MKFLVFSVGCWGLGYELQFWNPQRKETTETTESTEMKFLVFSVACWGLGYELQFWNPQRKEEPQRARRALSENLGFLLLSVEIWV